MDQPVIRERQKSFNMDEGIKLPIEEIKKDR